MIFFTGQRTAIRLFDLCLWNYFIRGENLVSEQRIETGDTPHVIVTTCQGALSVGSWIRSGVGVTGEAFTAESPEADTVTVRSQADLTIQMPPDGRLSLEGLHGPVTVKHLAGLVQIGETPGDLTLRDTNHVQVENVHQSLAGQNLNGALTVAAVQGDLTLRNAADVTVEAVHGAASLHYVNGRVRLDQVQGDAALHTVNDDLHLGRIHGELRLSNLGGQTRVEQVDGDLWLAGGLAGGEHSFYAEGDIYVYWPPDAPLNLIATGGTVDHRLLLQETAVTSTEENTTLTGALAETKTTLRLRTPGRIAILPWSGEEEPAFDPAAFAPAVFARETPPDAESAPDLPAQSETAGAIETAVTRVLEQLVAELGAAWRERFAAVQLEQRLTTALTAALAEAEALPAAPPAAPTPGEAAFAAAEEKVKASLDKAQRHVDYTRRRIQREETAGAAPPEAEEKPAELETEAEKPAPAAAASAQLRILQLLEDGALTVDEASQLLKSL
jgi:hypothetical protein